jgi:hypothetical protein
MKFSMILAKTHKVSLQCRSSGKHKHIHHEKHPHYRTGKYRPWFRRWLVGQAGNSKIESRAMKDLAKLQQTLDLSEDQKQKVYDVLMEDAVKSLASQSDADFVTRSMMSSMGVEMDLGDMDMGSVMTLHTDSEDAPTDRASMIKQMKENRQKKIDAKVERLAPVLDESQQQQYRKSLENKGGMFNMMIQGVEAGTSEEEVK